MTELSFLRDPYLGDDSGPYPVAALTHDESGHRLKAHVKIILDVPRQLPDRWFKQSAPGSG